MVPARQCKGSAVLAQTMVWGQVASSLGVAQLLSDPVGELTCYSVAL